MPSIRPHSSRLVCLSVLLSVRLDGGGGDDVVMRHANPLPFLRTVTPSPSSVVRLAARPPYFKSRSHFLSRLRSLGPPSLPLRLCEAIDRWSDSLREGRRGGSPIALITPINSYRWRSAFLE